MSKFRTAVAASSLVASARRGMCRRALVLTVCGGMLCTAPFLIRSSDAFAPCPGVLRFPTSDDVELSGDLEARAAATAGNCVQAPVAFTIENYAVAVVSPITSNCTAYGSDDIPTTTADTGLLDSGNATAQSTVIFYGTDPNDEDILGEGILGTFIEASFHYAVDFDLTASCSAGPNLPGAKAEFATDPDPLVIEIPFTVVELARYEADGTLTVGGTCVNSAVSGSWRIEKVGGGYRKTGNLSVSGAGTDNDSWQALIGLGSYTFTATLDDFTDQYLCVDTCPGSDDAVCTHSVDLDIDFEFEEAIFCPQCP